MKLFLGSVIETKEFLENNTIEIVEVKGTLAHGINWEIFISYKENSESSALYGIERLRERNANQLTSAINEYAKKHGLTDYRMLLEQSTNYHGILIYSLPLKQENE